MSNNKNHILNNSINKKIKKFFNSTKSTYLIIIFTFIFGLLLEILIGTHFFKTNTYDKTINYKNFDVLERKNNFIIRVDNINKFVNDMEIDLDFDTREKELKFKLYYYDKNDKKHFVQNNDLRMIDLFNPIVRVGHNVKKLELVFNTNNKNIKIKNINLSGKYDFNVIRFLAIIISIYLVLDLIKYIYLDKKPKLYLYFLKIFLIVGSFYAISTPFYYSWDEKEHMVRAYNVSRFNLLQHKDELTTWSTGLSNFIDNPYTISVPTTYKGFKNKISYILTSEKTESMYLIHNSTAIPYLFPAYLISGLGMFIARIFGLSFVFAFYFGRFFNVIFCSILLSLSIKYSGKYNKIFFMFGLLPLVLFQSASFSADAIVNSFAALSVALTLYYKNTKKSFDYKDWFLLLICYIMTFISKIAYFPISVLILMIPNKKFKNKKVAYFMKFMIIFICLTLFGIGTIYANKMGIVQWDFTNANSDAQLKNIINHPLTFPCVVFNTVNDKIISWFSSLLKIGSCGSFSSLVLVLFFIEFVVVIANSSNKTKLFDKMIILCYVVLSICASMGALYLSYSAVGSNIVYGYQGRYILPIIIPFLLLFVSDKFKLDVNENKIIYFILIISVLLYIISFFCFYINNFYY